MIMPQEGAAAAEAALESGALYLEEYGVEGELGGKYRLVSLMEW
jgi:hypothetical protein